MKIDVTGYPRPLDVNITSATLGVVVVMSLQATQRKKPRNAGLRFPRTDSGPAAQLTFGSLNASMSANSLIGTQLQNTFLSP
jgi:hypothetical protein